MRATPTQGRPRQERSGEGAKQHSCPTCSRMRAGTLGSFPAHLLGHWAGLSSDTRTQPPPLLTRVVEEGKPPHPAPGRGGHRCHTTSSRLSFCRHRLSHQRHSPFITTKELCLSLQDKITDAQPEPGDSARAPAPSAAGEVDRPGQLCRGARLRTRIPQGARQAPSTGACFSEPMAGRQKEPRWGRGRQQPRGGGSGR